MTEWIAERYRLGAELGRGGFAVVYEAIDSRSGRTVAIKVLRSADETSIRRLLREARLLADLGHPNVVQVRGAGILDDGGAFLVMERLHGHTLAARLSETFWLPMPAAIAISAQLLRAL